MSEPKVEAPTSPLSRKLGPFPVWLYLVVVGLSIFLVIYLKRQKSTADTSSTDTGTESASTVPPFINQVYTNTTPPVADTPTPAPTTITKNVVKENRHYVIQKGDTLESIAKKFYGKPGEWKVIFDANKADLVKNHPRWKNKVNPTQKLGGGAHIVIP